MAPTSPTGCSKQGNRAPDGDDQGVKRRTFGGQGQAPGELGPPAGAEGGRWRRWRRRRSRRGVASSNQPRCGQDEGGLQGGAEALLAPDARDPPGPEPARRL